LLSEVNCVIKSVEATLATYNHGTKPAEERLKKHKNHLQSKTLEAKVGRLSRVGQPAISAT